jgi:hypothetical protein
MQLAGNAGLVQHGPDGYRALKRLSGREVVSIIWERGGGALF